LFSKALRSPGHQHSTAPTTSPPRAGPSPPWL